MDSGRRSLPLEFTRITVRREETKKKTPKPSDIDGDWEGGPSNLRFVLHIITYEDGMTAKVDSPDQNAFGIPVTTITRDGAELKFEIKSIAGSYEGKINPGLTTISGNWEQGGGSFPLVLKRTRAVPKPADVVTEDLENLKQFAGAWKEEPWPDPKHDTAQTVIFNIVEGKLSGMERQLAVRYSNGEFFRDRDEFTPTGPLKVQGKTVSWRTRRLKYLGEGMDIQTRVTLISDNEAVLDYIAEISEGNQPLMLVPYRLTLKKQPDVKTLQSMPTVDQILDRFAQAIGGVTAHRKLTSQVIKSTLVIEDSDVTASIESYRQAPNKAVNISQVKLGNGGEFEVSRGFNGAVGWAFNPTDGGFRELNGNGLAAEKRDSEFNWEIKLKELYPKMVLAGQIPVGDRLAYCIEATPTEGDPVKLYFEVQTGLLVRLDSIHEGATGGKIPIETYFDDYREVDGVKVPFNIRQPKQKYTYKVNEVRHNIPIDEGKFKSPRPADLPSSLAAIEKAVEVNRRNLKVPGAALVIVKDDRVILLKGFGVRDVEKGLPVTPDTLFGIGSCTKTFTAMAAVISADEGKLSLDDAPKKFLPYFKLRDPEADANVTLRDLLCHRTGLEAHGNDVAWYVSERSREEVIRIGMESKPTAKFREKGQYSNMMYIAAGEAIGKAHNSTWEAVVDSRIFKPLGMNASNCSRRITQQAAEFSWGYDDQGEKWKTYFNRDGSAAAGAINSSARDMGQWLRLLLGGGVIDGKRIVSEKGFQEMLTKLAEVDGSTYGLGLAEYDSKSFGAQHYGHSGGIDGFAAKFVFAPAQKMGFAILTNGDDAGGILAHITTEFVLSHLLLQP